MYNVITNRNLTLGGWYWVRDENSSIESGSVAFSPTCLRQYRVAVTPNVALLKRRNITMYLLNEWHEFRDPCVPQVGGAHFTEGWRWGGIA